MATLDDAPYVVFVVDVHPETGRVQAIRLIANPDNLNGVIHT